MARTPISVPEWVGRCPGHRSACGRGCADAAVGRAGSRRVAHLRRDLASTRYSALDQITAENFGTLRIAWRFRTDHFGPRPEIQLQTTPLYVNGALYASVGSRRSAVSIDPANGELLWARRFDERPRTFPRGLSGRGVAYWESGAAKRVFLVSPGYQLLSIDAATGALDPAFGSKGVVDMRAQLGYAVEDVEKAEIGLHSAPIVVNGVIVVGAAHLPGGAPPTKEHIKGIIAGYDVRSGKQLWRFTAIPGHGQPGNETWLNESWTYTGNAGSWAQMSADEQLGLVYVPVEAPTGDWYGGHRPGDNLFSSSLVALEVKTGKKVWHFQITHHDIWDWDMPAAPILADITVDGKAIKAVAVPTKQNWLYVFDRTNGRPVWPIVETPVPKGDLPGEWYAATQPIPSKPPAFGRQGITLDDLIDFTPELKAKARGVREELPDRLDLGTAVRADRRRHARHLAAPGIDGRPELAGRLDRPREQRRLHLLEGRAGAGVDGEGPEAVQHGLHQRRRQRGRQAPRDRQPADPSSTLGQISRHRPQQGRAPVADGARRDRGRHHQPPGAQGRDDPTHRPHWRSAC